MPPTATNWPLPKATPRRSVFVTEARGFQVIPSFELRIVPRRQVISLRQWVPPSPLVQRFAATAYWMKEEIQHYYLQKNTSHLHSSSQLKLTVTTTTRIQP